MSAPSSKDVGALSAAPPNRVPPQISYSPHSSGLVPTYPLAHSTRELLWIKLEHLCSSTAPQPALPMCLTPNPNISRLTITLTSLLEHHPLALFTRAASMRCPLDVPHLNHQAALRAMNFRILILLGADAVFCTGAATVGKGVPPIHHRRLLDNIFTTKASLETAVEAYNANPTTAIATYGPIADWGVSGITDMGGLFYNLKNFDADVSNWDTSGVTDMSSMFQVRSTPVLPPICSRASTARWTLSPPSAIPHPRPAPYALLSTLGRARRRSTSR